MNLDTQLKKIQLLTAFIGICLGFFTDFLPFDTGFVFYVNFFAAAGYIAYVFFRNPKKMLSDYRTLLFLLVVLILSIIANLKYSDIYSLVMLMEMIIYLFASMIYTGKEDLGELSIFIRRLFRTITVILFSLTLLTLINGLFGIYLIRILPEKLMFYSAEQFDQWHYELMHLGTGGLYHNGNQLGLNAYISGMLSLYFLEKNKNSTFDKVNLVLQILGIAVSSCRSMLIASVITAAYLLSVSGWKNGKKLMRLIILVSIVILAIMTKNKLRYYFLRDGLEELIQKLSGYRSIIWIEGFNVFKNRPIFGVGINNLQKASFDMFGQSSYMHYRSYTSAHNFIINILAMTGMTGALAFLLLGRDIHYGLKRVSRFLAVMCCGVLIGDFFDIFVLFTDKLPSLLVPLIAGFGIQRMLKEEKHIYFFSNAMEEDLYRSIYVKEAKPGQQGQKFNRLIAEGFKLAGRNVTCCTAVPVSPALADYKIKKIKDHDIYHYSLSINISVLKNLWNMAAAFFCVLFSENGAVVLDTLSVDNAIGALAASKLRGMKSAGIVTDLPEHFSSDKTFSKMVYRIIRMCTSYVFLTVYMDERLNPEHKPWIVMEGLCDSAVEVKENHKREKKMIFAGEIDRENGVLNLADAFNAWGDHGYDLYFYGIGKDTEQLKEKAKDNPHIHVMGLIQNRELLRIMEDSSLLLNPRPIHQEFVKYSFPSKVMEYMNTGTFHASSRLACIPDEYFKYIGDLGDGSAEDILRFFTVFESMNDEEKELMGKQAQQFVLAEKNNKKQAERIALLLDGQYE